MTDTIQSQGNKPAYRLGFAPRTGTDRNGQPTLGYPIEIGAVFNRKDADKGLIAKFALIPSDMRDGVLLLMPLRDEADLFTQGEEAAR